MNRIKVLDCTLRDGGYNNEWLFGHANIIKMIDKLTQANLDIIECGFLTKTKEYNPETSLFNQIDQINTLTPVNAGQTEFVCMINFGEYEIEEIPDYKEGGISGIRVAFHKNDRFKALDYCNELVKKGYKVFIQPMVAISYTDIEYIDLINLSNQINPYAFYIVDSFGVMKRRDMLRLFYLVDHNLDSQINIGYHAHNNLQLAYSNAQTLIDLKTERNLIIDSSVYGMGRGAGNLNSELLIEYLNDINGESYQVKPLLQIIDEILTYVMNTAKWGYSLPQYLSALFNCHPNYATYLDDKKSLTVEDMSVIMSKIPLEFKNNFKTKEIESLYLEYQSQNILLEKSDFSILINQLKDLEVILILPGSSVVEEHEKVEEYVKSHKSIVIGVNYIPENITCDYVFVSNHRRYEAIIESYSGTIITSSNIKADNKDNLIIPYNSLLNSIDPVQDNAVLMLIKFLIQNGIKQVSVAGLDGYSENQEENYARPEMTFLFDPKTISKKNDGLQQVINEYIEKINIVSITHNKHINF